MKINTLKYSLKVYLLTLLISPLLFMVFTIFYNSGDIDIEPSVFWYGVIFLASAIYSIPSLILFIVINQLLVRKIRNLFYLKMAINGAALSLFYLSFFVLLFRMHNPLAGAELTIYILAIIYALNITIFIWWIKLP